MKEKIKWYKEVLELEPNSKLFLPLARLLSNSGQINEAIEYLQQGLVRYPEYVEARIYYIELLYTDNRTIQCQDQIENMTKLFIKYPSFWEAWGEYVISKGQSKELALALTFLAACFRDSNVNFSNIFEIGLSEFMLKKSAFMASKKNTNTSLFEAKDDFDKQGHNNLYDVVSQLKDSSALLEKTSQNYNNNKVKKADSGQASSKNIEMDSLPNAELAQDNENEQHFSLRTRSMADVLSAQGEIKKALDIYQELLHRASSEDETAELQERIDELLEQLKDFENNENDASSAIEESEQLEDGQSDAANVADGPKQSEGKDKLVSLLETLAVRFEERAL